MSEPILWYLADPMCSWCWGFTPAIEALRDEFRDRAKIALVLGGRLATLADGVSLARKTQHIIRQHLGWTLGYNLIAIPAAALGHVTPWIAGIGMSASSLLVVLNALRLSDFKHTSPPAAEALPPAPVTPR